MNKLILSLLLTVGFLHFDTAAQSSTPLPNAKTGGGKSQKDNRNSSPDIVESNRLTAETNQQIERALADGAAAYTAKNYQLAIEKFDEGYRLAPDYWGTAPVLLNNKAIALRVLGAEKYNLAIQEKRDPAREANGYFLAAVEALKESKKILENTVPPEDESGRALIDNTLYTARKELAESCRLLAITDETRVNEAIEAYENYIKIEKDESLKRKAEENLRKLRPRYKVRN